MTFSEYYGDLFQKDLEAVVRARPSTHNKENKQPYVIQPAMLSLDGKVIRSWNDERITHFATALFFNVLFDQVFYTHYQKQYPLFQSLTYYPKFIGNCPTSCRMNLHPTDVFYYFGSRPASANARDLMHHELRTLLENNFPDIDLEEVWSTCVDEFPIQFTIDSAFSRT